MDESKRLYVMSSFSSVVADVEVRCVEFVFMHCHGEIKNPCGFMVFILISPWTDMFNDSILISSKG